MLYFITMGLHPMALDQAPAAPVEPAVTNKDIFETSKDWIRFHVVPLVQELDQPYRSRTRSRCPT